MLVAGGALALAWLLGIPRWLGQIGALAAIAAYVLAVGAQPSVIRAGVSGALVSLAWLAARPADRWHFFLLGALVLLAWNPYTLLDPGFQLSFAAVAAIFVLVPRLLKAFEGYPLPDALAGVVAVSTACGLATAPILWLQFHALPLLTVPANALAAPAVPPLLALAFAAALVGTVSPPAAGAIAWLNGWCAAYLAACARLVGGLPGAQVRSGRALLALLLVRDGRGRRLCLAPVAELLSAYLITGTDKPKVTRALRRLRDRVGEDATEHLSAHESSGEDVAAACNALGLFTVERRLVDRRGRRALEGADLKAVQEYLKRPAPTTVLALVGDDVKKDSALAKAVAKAGEVLNFDLPTRGRGSKADLPKWVQQQFRDRGVADRPRGGPSHRRARRRERAGARDRGRQAHHLGRRRADRRARGRRARPRESRDAAVRPDRLVGTARRSRRAGRERAARRALGRRRARRPAPHRRPADQPRRPRARMPGARRPRGPAGRCGRAPEAQPLLRPEALRAGAELQPEELGSAIVRLADLDLALKGGSKLPGELEFARALIEITRPAEPAKSAARLGARARDEPGGLRLLAGGGVPVQRAASGGLVDPADERAVLLGDPSLVAVVHGRLQAAREGLHRRGVAEVLEPLLGRGPDALLLLLDVRHGVKMPAARAGRW